LKVIKAIIIMANSTHEVVIVIDLTCIANIFFCRGLSTSRAITLSCPRLGPQKICLFVCL